MNGTTAIDAVTLVFQHMSARITEATDISKVQKLDDGVIGSRDGVSDIVFGIVGAVQAIVADLSTAIGKSLDFFNHCK